MKKTETFIENTCPLCNHQLGVDERKALDKRFNQLIQENSSKKVDEANKKVGELKQQIEKNIQMAKDEKDKAIRENREYMENWFKGQLAETKKIIEDNSKKDIARLEAEKLKLEQDYKTIQKKIDEESELKAAEKINENEQKYKVAIIELKTQLERVTVDLESAKKKAEGKSSELIGVAGEINLYKILQDEFPQDRFELAKKGEECGDICQLVSRDQTHIILRPIVMDNKQNTSVTKSDIEKANRYKTIHNTNYVIIVSSKPPAEIGNRLIGEKEGVLIVHPSIIVEVVRQIRQSLMDIEKSETSKVDRDKKEQKLFVTV